VNIGTQSDGGGYGRVAFTWNDQALSTITDMGYWYNLQAGNGSPNWDSGPYMNIEIDTDADGSTDAWVLHKMFFLSPGTGTWLQWELSDDPIDSQYVEHNSTDMWHVWDGAAMTDYALWADVLAAHGDDTVKKIKIAVGDWASDIETRHYVDDIQINGVTYCGTIQDGIDSASTGDTISVYPGTYAEALNIDEEVTLTGVTAAGANNWTMGTAGAGTTAPTISYDDTAHMIAAHEDNTTIQGFNIDTTNNAATRAINFGDLTTAQDGFTIQYCSFTSDDTERVISLSDNRLATNFTISYCAFTGTGAQNWFTVGEDGGCSATSTNTVSYNSIDGLVSQLRLGENNIYDITYSNNTFSNAADGGILLIEVDAEAGAGLFGDIVVQYNSFAGGGSSDYAFMVSGISGNVVEDADFEGGSFSADDVVFNYNSLGALGAGSFEAVSFDVPSPSADLDAQYNWWNATTGPDDAGDKNPYYVQAAAAGAADCSLNVDFLPWMNHHTLGGSWYIYSTPIAADASTNTITEALDFWGSDSGNVTAAYYYNGNAQAWATATSLTPMVPVYLNLSASSTIDVLVSATNTAPPSMTMYQGWNLVGPAQLYEMTEVDTMLGAYEGTGEAGLVGYTQIISPSIGNQTDAWVYIRGAGTAKNMIPTEGYWVYMANQGTLGGFTYTPIAELP
jgi:hypothetical protein